MDFTILPIEKVQATFERALELDSDHEIAVRATAQALGITVEAVREVVGLATPMVELRVLGYGLTPSPTARPPRSPVSMYHGSPDCAGYAHPLSGRTEVDAC